MFFLRFKYPFKIGMEHWNVLKHFVSRTVSKLHIFIIELLKLMSNMLENVFKL